MEGLNLNGNGNDDEYDMVDELDDPAPGSQRNRPSKLKYMNILQDVANRGRSDILIDLNDLEAVCRACWRSGAKLTHCTSMRRLLQTKTTTTG